VDTLELIRLNYETIFAGQYDVGHKQFTGPSLPKICRFCEKSSPEISFRNKAHAIPELLGNRQLVVTDECDVCNSLFARSIEDHLGKFTKPYRLMGQVRGMNGIPSYKTPKGLSRIDFQPSEGLEIQHHQDDHFIEIVEDENRVRINFIIERHSPSAVYKALVKIALSVMSTEELRNFTHAKRWILHSEHTQPLFTPLKLLFYFVPGPKPHSGTSIMLLRKYATSVDDELPYCLLLLAFGNLQYQIMVPALSDNRGKGIDVPFKIPRFPSAFGADWPYGAPMPAEVDLSSGELTEPKQFTLSLHYGSIGETVG